MIKNSESVTISLAKAYSAQGHAEQALEIYTHLLQNSPDDPALQTLIADLKNAKPQETAVSILEPTDLAGLFETWMKLTVKYKKIMMLKRLKRLHR